MTADSDIYVHLQHYLTMLGSTVLIPFLIVPPMGGTFLWTPLQHSLKATMPDWSSHVAFMRHAHEQILRNAESKVMSGRKGRSEYCCRYSRGPRCSDWHDLLHIGLDHSDADHCWGQAAYHPGLMHCTIVRRAPAAYSHRHTVASAAAQEPMLF